MKSLDKHVFFELSAYPTPPPKLLHVVNMVLIILTGEGVTNWRNRIFNAFLTNDHHVE